MKSIRYGLKAPELELPVQSLEIYRVGVFNRTKLASYTVGVWFRSGQCVFLTMLTLYPDGRLTGFALATKTCGAAKVYWRRLNSKRSLPVLKWASESEYFER